MASTLTKRTCLFLQKKEDMITAAKLIAVKGENLVRFARILAKYCKDKRYVPCLLIPSPI